MNTTLSFFRRGDFKKIILLTFILFTALITIGLFFDIKIKTNTAYAQSTIKDFIGTNNTSSEIKDLSIFPPKAIGVFYNEEELKLFTYANTVEEVLNENSIEYSKYDIISPELDANIIIINTIKIDSIEKELKETISNIPFPTETIADPERNYGTREIIQKGVDGLKLEIHKKLYLDEELLSKELYSKEILEEPTKEIVIVGTNKNPLEGSRCPHWYSVIDNITTDEDERVILKSLIRCESGCNAAANNSNTYLGLLQFHINTFLSYSNNGDVWNGEEQIRAALRILRSGGLEHHWPHCSRDL